VTPVNVATNKAGKTIKVGASPGVIAITPGSRFGYVANNGSGTVTAIRVATNTALRPIKVRIPPAAIAITPDGKTVWVTGGCTASSSMVRGLLPSPPPAAWPDGIFGFEGG
jgi:YVTN family beta-propeller protein